MTYKPNSHYMDIIMCLSRKLGVSPQRVIEEMINEYTKDDTRLKSIYGYKVKKKV